MITITLQDDQVEEIRALVAAGKERESADSILLPQPRKRNSKKKTAVLELLARAARQARYSRLIRQVGTDLIALDGPDARLAPELQFVVVVV